MSADLERVIQERDRLATERERLDFVINSLRHPLGIDPAIKNMDTERILAAFHEALVRLGVLPKGWDDPKVNYQPPIVPPMRWWYKVIGAHTHVRVFLNGAKCGDLCFRNEEFREITRLPGLDSRAAPWQTD